MPLIGALAVLTTVTLWGVNFTFVKLAIAEMPPIAVSAFRFGILFVLLSPFLRVARAQLPRILVYALLMGVCHFTVLFVAMQHLDVTTTGIVMQLNTPFVVLLAWLMLGEAFGLWRAIGMGIAFSGAIVLVGVPTVGVDPVWLLALVFSSFMWAFSSIRAKQIKGVKPFTLIAWMALVVTPVTIGLSWVFEDGQLAAIRSASPTFWFSIAYIVICSSVIAYGLWYWCLNRFDVTALAPFNLLTPLVAVVCGVVVLGDQITLTKAIGGIMIVGGVGLITVRQIVVARRAKASLAAAEMPQ